jgi:hypothetical protein
MEKLFLLVCPIIEKEIRLQINANFSLNINNSLWFDHCPIIFRSDLVINRFGTSVFRFS